MLIVFDRNRSYIEIFRRGENWLELIGKWPAANNVASNARGPWPVGLYKAEKLVKLPPGDDDPNGPYGAWFLRFIVPDRDGVDDAVDIGNDGLPDVTDGAGVGLGLHAGRRDGKDAQGRSGPFRATLGCIRTVDEAMEAAAKMFPTVKECWLAVLP